MQIQKKRKRLNAILRQNVDKVRHTRAGFFFCGLIGRFLEIYQLISVIIEVS